MKKLRYLSISAAISLFAFTIPIIESGCSTPPSARVVQVQSLKGVGQSAEAAVTLSAQLYKSGTISAMQAKEVLDFYDLKFQPAYRLAVSAVQANLDSLASPDIINLANQLTTLVVSFQNHTP